MAAPAPLASVVDVVVAVLLLASPARQLPWGLRRGTPPAVLVGLGRGREGGRKERRWWRRREGKKELGLGRGALAAAL